jgi:hypothetical protein
MQCCYEWRHSFASEAISAVAAHWKTDPVVVRVCAHDASPPLPFIWESYNVADPSKKVIYIKFVFTTSNNPPLQKCSGAFCSPFVLKPLVNHLHLISTIPDDIRIDEPPRGALALSLAAVTSRSYLILFDC